MIYYCEVAGKGRGVFSDCDLLKGDIVETCPIVIAKTRGTSNPLIKHHYLDLGNSDKAMMFGYGSLYNHSFDPNIVLDSVDIDKKEVLFKAIKDIPKDTELCFDYQFSSLKEAIDWGLEPEEASKHLT